MVDPSTRSQHCTPVVERQLITSYCILLCVWEERDGERGRYKVQRVNRGGIERIETEGKIMCLPIHDQLIATVG